MLERIIAESNDRKVVVAQDLLEVDIATDASLVSTVGSKRENIKQVLICLPGYPGDAIETLNMLGRHLATNNGEIVTVVIGYPGVTSRILPLGVEGLQERSVLETTGEYSFMTAAKTAEKAIKLIARVFPNAAKYLLGISYGASFATMHLGDQRLAGIVFLNPLIDIERINRDYEPDKGGIRGLLEYGISTGRIRGRVPEDVDRLYQEQRVELAATVNPLQERVTSVAMPVYIYTIKNDPGFAPEHVDGLQKRVRELGGTAVLNRGFYRADHNFSEPRDRRILFELIRQQVLRL